MKNLVILMILCLPFMLVAQINQSVEPTDFSEKKYGANNRHHIAFTLRYGGIIGDNETANEAKLTSKNWSVGIRYKRKITNAIHFNTELSYDVTDYRFKDIHYVPGTGYVNPATQQNSGFKSISYTRFFHQNVELAPSIRIRFNKGQGINWFTDLGAYGYVTVAGNYTMVGKNLIYGDTRLTSKLVPDNTFGYGGFARFGYKFFALYYKYRAVQPFDDLNLQPHTIGLELMINING